MRENCRFCEIGTGLYGADFNRPYMQSKEYFAIPSIGGFVEGWSLLSPVDHVYNLRNRYGKPEYVEFFRSVVGRIHATYGPPIIFEHGSSHRGSLTSCGTDHAHLHIVPLGRSLSREIKKSGKVWIYRRASALAELPAEQEYLFYSDDVLGSDPIGLVHLLEEPTSQFFRRLIAGIVGRVDESDYRQYPFLSLASQTQHVLAEA